jgi:hypothetical protein
MFFNRSIFWLAVLSPKIFMPSFDDQKRNPVATGGCGLWKYTLAHIVRVIFCGTQDHFPELRVLFYKRRHEPIKEAENVVANQHLAVAVRAGFRCTAQSFGFSAGATYGLAAFGGRGAHDLALASFSYGQMLGHVVGEGH